MKFLILSHQNRAARTAWMSSPKDTRGADLEAYFALHADLAASQPRSSAWPPDSPRSEPERRYLAARAAALRSR